MRPIDLTRPDKLLLKGIKDIGSISQNLYSFKKSQAKAKAELTFIGEKQLDEVTSQLYSYTNTGFSEELNPQALRTLNEVGKDQKHWLNFHGIHDVNIVQKVGEDLNLDRLTVRQILDTTQRPKLIDNEDHLFFTLKSILRDDQGQLDVEQLSIVLGKQYVVTFQEKIGDHFQGIRDKITEGVGFIRKKSIDYLLVQLIDGILDNYFETIDQMNQDITLMESEILSNPGNNTLIALENYKRSALTIRKALNPLKESLANILNTNSELIREENRNLYKDLSNTSIAAMEEIEATLKTIEGLTNIYFSSLSQKMNETMKVLTTVATIFIPLTFIAGIYGMNFDNMPELKYKYGYFVVWGIMGVVVIGMLIYFKRKKWM